MKNYIFIFCIFLFLVPVVFSTIASVLKSVTIVNNEPIPFVNLGVIVSLNTLHLIAIGDLKPDGSDLRFTLNQTGAGILSYRYDMSTFNTTNTKLLVKVPFVPLGSSEIWLWYKNASLGPYIAPNNTFDDFVYTTSATLNSGFIYHDTITIPSGVTINVNPGSGLVTLMASKIIISGSINGIGAGTLGQFWGGNGLGVGQWSQSSGAGGSGYGGIGGSGGYDVGNTVNLGGPTYGSPSSLGIELGSPGAGSSWASGGNAGASLSIQGDYIEVSPGATIDVSGGDGAVANPGGGGGSGGGLLIWGNSFMISGTLNAIGGGGANSLNDLNDGGGGGGGGRIKIFSSSSSSTTATFGANFAYSVNGGPGGCCGNYAYGTSGSNGTFYSGTTTSSPVVFSIVANSGTCIPTKSCASEGLECGILPDNGCQQQVQCPLCSTGFICSPFNYSCVSGTFSTTEVPVFTTEIPASGTAAVTSNGANVGLIAGVVLGVLFLLALIAFGIFCAYLAWRRWGRDMGTKERKKIPQEVELKEDMNNYNPNEPAVSTNYVGIGMAKNFTQNSAPLLPSTGRVSGKISGNLNVNRASVNLSQTWNINYNEIKFERELGRGAYGIVFLATWRMQKVAVKKIKEEGFTEKQMNDFTSEAQLYMTLRPHKNVVIFLGVTLTPLCIVTEYLENGSLESWIKKDVKLDMGTVLKMAKDIAAGMGHLHAEGIVHRDLATRNLLLDENMNVKITDFGMSRVLESEANNTASEVGPLKWMAPESITAKQYSFKSDVYMYGMTLIELLTRNDPYPNLGPMEVAIMIVRDGYRHPIPDYTPEALATLIARCWRTQPEERPDFKEIYQTLDEM